MFEHLDVRFSFFCRNTHTNAEGQNPIILRVSFNTDRRDLFTGLYCKKSEWNSFESKLFNSGKSANPIDKNLELILHKANHIFDSLRFSGNVFSIDELIDKIKGKDKRPELLIEFLEEEIEKVKKRIGIDLTKSSYYRYRRTLVYLQDFLMSEFKMKNYTLNRIDLKFIEPYFQYLRSVKNLCHNTAFKFVQMVKSNLLPAIKLGIIKNDPFRELKIKPKPVHRDFLTQEEINKISSTILKDPDLERKRNIFLPAA